MELTSRQNGRLEQAFVTCYQKGVFINYYFMQQIENQYSYCHPYGESIATLYAAARETVASWIVERRDGASNFNASKSRAAISTLSLRAGQIGDNPTHKKPQVLFFGGEWELERGREGESRPVPEKLRRLLCQQPNSLKCKCFCVLGISIYKTNRYSLSKYLLDLNLKRWLKELQSKDLCCMLNSPDSELE